jgi:hypothetical protein
LRSASARDALERGPLATGAPSAGMGASKMSSCPSVVLSLLMAGAWCRQWSGLERCW